MLTKKTRTSPELQQGRVVWAVESIKAEGGRLGTCPDKTTADIFEKADDISVIQQTKMISPPSQAHLGGAVASK